MTAKIIISAVNPEETRMGIVENGRLMEYVVERNNSAQLVGSIFLGRVCNVVRGIQAAFIDIGLDKNAFLYLGDKTGITEGQRVLVEITKDARGSKGPTATLDISLAGRYAALLPEANYTGISRKITDSAERSRLKKFADDVTNGAAGAVMRTNAAGMPEEVLRADLQQLMADWQIIQARAKLARSPQVLHRELDISVRIVRDYLNACIDEVVVDSPAVYGRLQELLQNIAESRSCKLLLHDKQTDIFSYYRLSDDIASISDRRIDLPSGGYLVIDYTEAMTVIDVNSGHFSGRENLAETVMQINREAADEIARQLRLRDLGGIVIIDFIDLHKAQNKQALFDEMVKLMATDKAKHTVLPLTKFGLMQITRQRVRPVAVESVSDVCPTCNGSGKIEPTVLLDKKIENQISFLTQDRGHKFIKLVVSPYVAAFLRKGLWSLRRRWEWKYKVRLEIAEDQSIGIVEIHYHDKKDNDLITK